MTMQAEAKSTHAPVPIAVPGRPQIASRHGVSSLGFGLVLTKLRRRLWSTRRAIAVCREAADADLLASPADGLRVDLVQPDDFTVLADLVANAAGVEYLYVRPIERTRQARAGTVSVATNAAGELVAFHFIHETHNHEALNTVAPNMYPKLPTDEVLTEAVYCLPAHRGHALAPRLLQATGSIMAARGKRRAWAYLDTTNIAALRMFNRAGYHPSGEERVDRYRFGRFSTAFRPLTPKTQKEWQTILAGSRPEPF
jgi:GNAT superfamily N-acetyltransferase